MQRKEGHDVGEGKRTWSKVGRRRPSGLRTHQGREPPVGGLERHWWVLARMGWP